MKKILFAAFAVSLLTVGCQKTEIIHQVAPTDGSIMSFSTEMSKLTKSSDNANPSADKDGMYNLRAQEFRIWAYCDYEDDNTGVNKDDPYDGMENLNIAYSAEATSNTGAWAPEKEYYWPSGAGKALRFFAVSGVELGKDLSSDWNKKVKIAINRTNDNVSTSLTIENYTVDNKDPNTDLMVADVVTHDKNANNKLVNFTFRHALSKVQFNFKTGDNPDEAVTVKSLTVKKIKTIGTLSVQNNNISWNGQGLSKNEEDNTFSATPEGGVTLTSQEATLATWLVIPQEIVTTGTDGKATGYKVEVVYQIGTREFTSTFPLYVTENNRLVKWDKNQYTKYLVTITPNKITFHAEAQEWTPYDSDNDANVDADEDEDGNKKNDGIDMNN